MSDHEEKLNREQEQKLCRAWSKDLSRGLQNTIFIWFCPKREISLLDYANLISNYNSLEESEKHNAEKYIDEFFTIEEAERLKAYIGKLYPNLCFVINEVKTPIHYSCNLPLIGTINENSVIFKGISDKKPFDIGIPVYARVETQYSNTGELMMIYCETTLQEVILQRNIYKGQRDMLMRYLERLREGIEKGQLNIDSITGYMTEVIEIAKPQNVSFDNEVDSREINMDPLKEFLEVNKYGN